jgi:TatD DNase family protein
MLVDLHCHLDLYPDPAAVLKEVRESGTYVLSVTTTPSAWRGTTNLAKGLPRVRTALGLHPELAHERAGELPLFEALIREARYVGEIGLDGSPHLRAHAPVQLETFNRILRATARAGGRIMSIHSRRAVSEVLAALRRVPDAGVPILHWFTGTRDEVALAIDMGCYFSIGPAMLATARGRELVAAMPERRVLTETDGPFAMVDGRPLRPIDVSGAMDSLDAIHSRSSGHSMQLINDVLRDLVQPRPLASPESQ